jgi:hypothetical protein
VQVLVPGLVCLESRDVPAPVKLVPLACFTWQGAAYRERVSEEGAEQTDYLLQA